ncbi:MAG: FAD-dependent oxidoreductase [Methanomicrobiaceae archaeon]|nr:FAD-dependent oxidoreductase [Methanomicrobiaceae archaeon]
MPEVKVYTTKGCQYCRLTKAFLQNHGVEYTEIDVGTDRDKAEEMVELTGQLGVPVTVVGEEVIIGFDLARLKQLFEKPGEDGLYDVVIIGGGPAGLTAGVYVARKMLRGVILTENVGGQALESWAIENYMGYRMVTGEELISKFEDQVRELNIHIELDSVAKVEKEDGKFLVHTASEQSFLGTALIITSGVAPRWLGLPGEEKFIGHGESICATCDGPLFRDKVVAVVGGGNYALTTAIEMSKLATKVHLIVRSSIKADEIYKRSYEAKENIVTHTNYVVSALHGDAFLSGITIRERETGEEKRIDVEGLFLAIGHEPNTGFLDGFLETNRQGEIIVDENCHTSKPGVFAAGDVTCVNGKQVIIAAGEGAKAALEAYDYVMRSGS